MPVSLVRAWIGLALLVIWVQTSHAQPYQNTLKPFATDGCSLWIDGPAKSPYLWRHCCVAHDVAYWQGGSEQARLQSDKELQACIAGLAGQGMANYMYFFVSTGGDPLWLTPYRWGYGWNYVEAGKPRGYKVLTENEQAQVNALLPQAKRTIAEDAQKHPSDAKTLQLFK
jgi:hypothetical protein